MVTEMLIT